MLQLVKELFFLAPQPTTEVYNLICIFLFLLNAFLSIMKKKISQGRSSVYGSVSQTPFIQIPSFIMLLSYSYHI